VIPTQIQHYIVNVDTPAVYAYYIVHASTLYPLALVCDSDEVLVGVISGGDLNPVEHEIDIMHKKCGEICNRNFSYIKDSSEDAIYGTARNIFAEKRLSTLPIVDYNGIPIRMFGKFQAFFHDQYLSLPYFYYAMGLMDAAVLAKSRGYERISAIEFGVASGRGLICMELFAREVQRLMGVSICVYGFDSGIGLMSPVDYRDFTQIWIEGDYTMDVDSLDKKLYNAKLVIGDICKTTKTFLEEYTPDPIGFISVDVDQYTPSVAILDMLLNDDKYFLPIVTLYFDDIAYEHEFQGEALAIKEFNANNKDMKISPEGFKHLAPKGYTQHLAPKDNAQFQAMFMKTCHRFNHFKYATTRKHNNVLTNII
jgi:hypothetical protein